MQTECLVLGGSETTLHVTVRFLQLVARLVGELHHRPCTIGRRKVSLLAKLSSHCKVGDVVHHAWQEAVEQKIDLGDANLLALVDQPRRLEFRLPSGEDREPLRDADGAIVGLFDSRASIDRSVCGSLGRDRRGGDFPSVGEGPEPDPLGGGGDQCHAAMRH